MWFHIESPHPAHRECERHRPHSACEDLTHARVCAHAHTCTHAHTHTHTHTHTLSSSSGMDMAANVPNSACLPWQPSRSSVHTLASWDLHVCLCMCECFPVIAYTYVYLYRAGLSQSSLFCVWGVLVCVCLMIVHLAVLFFICVCEGERQRLGLKLITWLADRLWEKGVVWKGGGLRGWFSGKDGDNWSEMLRTKGVGLEHTKRKILEREWGSAKAKCEHRGLNVSNDAW